MILLRFSRGPMSEEKKEVYYLKCSRCEKNIESFTKPAPKMSCFLCNSCFMLWKEKESKLLGHAYEDEMRAQFIKFIEIKPWTYNNDRQR